MDPLVPTVLDGALTALGLGALVLALAAFISLIHAAPPSGRRFLAWTLVVLFVPVAGPAAWFVARHRERAARPERSRIGS